MCVRVYTNIHTHSDEIRVVHLYTNKCTVAIKVQGGILCIYMHIYIPTHRQNSCRATSTPTSIS
jgi:hypothetical protein